MIVSIGKKSTFLITLSNIHLGNFSALEKQTIGIIKIMATFSSTSAGDIFHHYYSK